MQTIGRTVGRVFIGMCLWGIGLCVLFGCAASAPAFPVTEHFRCEADVVCGGERFSGTLVRGAAGTLRWEMTAPESVRGCAFGWDGEALTLTAQGLSFAVEPTSLPETAPVRVLLSAQKRMMKQGQMQITCANETVMEIFEITGFSDILTIL